MAKTGVTTSIQNYLFEIQKNQSLLSGDYLNDETDVNFIEMLKHLYPEASDRMKLLNPGSYIGNIVGDKIKNFVGDPKSAFTDIDYDIVVEGILTRGEILFKYTNVDDNELGLKEVDPSTYYDDGETEFIIKMYEKPVDDLNVSGSVETYLYVQSYKDSILRNKLYKIPSYNSQSISEGDVVPLSTLPQTKGLEPKQEVEDLDRLVIVIPVTKKPLVDIITSIIYSVDRKIAEAEKNYNDYVEQFKVFQNIDIPKKAYRQVAGGKVIDWDLLGKIVQTTDLGGIGDIKIVKNTNELLDKALERVKDQIIQISSITDVPLEFFGIKTVTDSGNGKVVGYTAFYKRITKYRNKIEKGLRIGIDELSIEDKSIIWEAIIRMSDEDILANETVKLQGRMTSLKRAIMKAHNVDEAEALIIIEEVKQDQADGLLLDAGGTAKAEDTVNKTNAKLDVD